jgi:hypothetical protein
MVIPFAGSFSVQNITPVIDGQSGRGYMILSLSPFIGYFVSDGLELGVDPFGINIISGGGNSFSQVNVFLSTSYNFRTERAGYPFVEGLVGYSSVSDGSNSSGISWGLRGGVKVGVAGQALVNVAVQYFQYTSDPENTTRRYGSNQLGVVAGFTIWP